jgi:Rod binding domain-containing protein
VSESSKLPGIEASQSSDLSAWSARYDAAQAARKEAQVQQAAAGLKGAGAAQDPKEMAKLRKVSQDFESLFLAYMMKTMKESALKSEFMGQSQGEKIFTEMKDEELAKGMASAGGIGLAKLLEQQLVQSLKPSKAAPNA